ncbi:MAG TPA: UDP-N-acetylglucosamine--N-acetylmuramyl-(pentapeptide) pyrophosphoryl-undecaprenol N-acetylglucosamine transferase [Chlamydiales bacterium]|nr:UDP-N-acetylglucosamine--N-acetylmuramyl-(pentapeptide) pyrophosphoryl-undecaprenol N-acetylglucosamine transferase [Chlamydiales bacterium]
MSKRNIAVAVGGTGGHILPAKQLASLLKSNSHLFFMGKGLLNSPYLKDVGAAIFDIPSAGIRKKNLWQLILAGYFITLGVVKSLYLLKKHKIEKVVGFGSFHAFPVMLAARLLNIPLFLFEANCTLGKVNRFFAKKASLALQFPLSTPPSSPFTYVRPLPWVKPKTVFEKKEARLKLHLKEDLFTILVFGGSQGAQFLNQLMKESFPKMNATLQIIHLAGTDSSADELREFYKRNQIEAYVASFETRMPLLFSAADLVIGRSGAGTISELIYFSRPAFLIPYPYAADNHQEENARFFVEQVGGGKYSSQKDTTPSSFTTHLQEMCKKDLLVKWEKNILRYKEKEAKKEKKDFASLI